MVLKAKRVGLLCGLKISTTITRILISARKVNEPDELNEGFIKILLLAEIAVTDSTAPSFKWSFTLGLRQVAFSFLSLYRPPSFFFFFSKITLIKISSKGNYV